MQQGTLVGLVSSRVVSVFVRTDVVGFHVLPVDNPSGFHPGVVCSIGGEAGLSEVLLKLGICHLPRVSNRRNILLHFGLGDLAIAIVIDFWRFVYDLNRRVQEFDLGVLLHLLLVRGSMLRGPHITVNGQVVVGVAGQVSILCVVCIELPIAGKDWIWRAGLAIV